MRNPKKNLFSFFLVLVVVVFCLIEKKGVKRDRIEGEMNVILIVVDALRWDHLSLSGYERITSPNIDEFALQNLFFSNVFSQGSTTRLSIPALITGNKYANLKEGYYLNPEEETLGEKLNHRGYYTVAFMTNPYLKQKFGFNQGFEEYHFLDQWDREYAQANYVTDEAIKFLDNNQKKLFFMWIYYMDAHAPYNPPRKYFNRNFESQKEKTNYTLTKEEFNSLYDFIKKSEIQELDYYISQYDGEITYLDKNIGRLIESIEDIGLMDDTMIIITADHGEEFLDHGSWTHGDSLYEEIIHIPLILHLPSNKGRQDNPIEDLFSTIDIVPLILNVVDGHADSADASFAKWRNNTKKTYVSGKTWDKQYVRTQNWKLIYNKGQEHELYNLKVDPKEKNNVCKDNIEKFDELTKYLEKNGDNKQKDNNSVLDKETKKKLRSLGYLN